MGVFVGTVRIKAGRERQHELSGGSLTKWSMVHHDQSGPAGFGLSQGREACRGGVKGAGRPGGGPVSGLLARGTQVEQPARPEGEPTWRVGWKKCELSGRNIDKKVK